MSIILQHGNLIDGTGMVVPDATVVIDGTTISTVGTAAQVETLPGEHQIIDVSGMTIMPGMMDLHDHLHGDASGIPDETPHDRFGETIHLIEDRDGILTAPRIFYCATLDMTHPPGKKQVHGVACGNITGPFEAVRAVREKVGLGADWIHLRATGAAAGQFGANTELLTLEEMEAAAKTAHNFGLRVTCNACGANGMKNAILAGVDCIEHGTHIGEDDEIIQMMVDREVGWVPTLWVSLAKKVRMLKPNKPKD